jgi:anthranilate synthase component 1
MNMGTLTGAPKPEAMNLISEIEKSARGFFGGGVGFITSRDEMETAIVIRAMRILGNRVFVRAGAGIVADSVADNEWMETERKARACIQALKEASHDPRA